MGREEPDLVDDCQGFGRGLQTVGVYPINTGRVPFVSVSGPWESCVFLLGCVL